MKMKVKVSKLQDAIHRHVAQEKKRFEKESAQYVIDMDKANARYVENVATYLTAMRGGKPHLSNYELGNHLERGCKFPSEPKKANEHKDLLVKLDLAEDQILVVDDHSDYMRFLSGKCVC